jgi:O-antigen/teichoic acid export membrane protein
LTSLQRPSELRRIADRLAGASQAVWGPLVRASAVVLGISVVAQLLALGLQLLFARLLGPVEFGIYSFVFAGLGLCLILAKFGLDSTLVRLTAQFSAQRDFGRLLGLVRLARIAGPVLGVLVGVVALVVITYVGQPESTAMYQSLVVGALLLPLAALSELTAAALRGLRRVVVALGGDGVVRPCVAGAGILMVAVIAPQRLSGAAALLTLLAGTIASLMVTSIVLNRELPDVVAVADSVDRRRYLRTATSLMLASGFLVAMYSLDTVMLGALADTTAAGFYSVASRIALLVLFVMNAAQTVAAPMLAAASGAQESGELRGLVRTLNGLAILAAVPASLVLLLGADVFLSMFGDEFRAAAPALRILVLAQLLNVFTGPTGMVLSMTGQERSLVFLLLGALGINALLNLLWIPAYGVVGAAASALVAHAAWNIAGAWLIRWRLAIDITLFDLLRRRAVRPA